VSISQNVDWKPTRNLPGRYNKEFIFSRGRLCWPRLCLCYHTRYSTNALSGHIQPMFCHIYRSIKRLDTYLYLQQKDDFSEFPQDLLQVFGEPEFSFSFNLTLDRKLAKEDTSEVLENLQNQGYHLQLQDDVLIEQMLAMKAVN